MKTLLGRFRFIVLGAIVTFVVASCCNFPFVTDTILYYAIEIGHPLLASKPPAISPRTYVEWKKQRDFDDALAQVRHNNGKICVCVLLPGGTPYPHRLNNDCDSTYNCPPDHIRTVKITKSKAAANIAAGESAANDPHVTYRVQSPDPGDITKVLSTLK